MEIDLETWVGKSSNPITAEQRQAIHIVLYALALTERSGFRCALKGGILTAIAFSGDRHTTDIDLSTDEPFTQKRCDEFVSALRPNVKAAASMLPYGVDCQVQSCQVKPDPTRGDRDYFTLTIKVGHAAKGTPQHQKLLSGKASRTVNVDYSYFEPIPNSDSIDIEAELTLSAYSIVDLVAEKLRAMIQQPDRNRARRQDVYDLYRVLELGYVSQQVEKIGVLESLAKKCGARSVRITRESLDDTSVREMSARHYGDLASEIQSSLPEFDLVYEAVRTFYRSLPWGEGA